MSRRRPWLIGAAAAVVVVVALGVPVSRLLPFGVFLLCPLLMLGMHGSHGHTRSGGVEHHGNHGDGSPDDEIDPPSARKSA